MRLNLSSPSGGGKTFSALLMAYGLVGDWSKIAVIDTEAGSASLYSHLGEFNTIDLQPPYSPERYIEAIDACIKAGMQCVIIDSSTHEWNGAGGCLESNDKLAAVRFKGNTWAAWNETTPRHDAFVNKVLQSPVHFITCTRSKTETVQGDDKKVKKVGMKDLQREGWEYELTVSLNIDRDTHMATPSKDRTNLFEGKQPFVITEETGKVIKKWCESGVSTEPAKKPITAKQIETYVKRLEAGEELVDKITSTFELNDAQSKQIARASFVGDWQRQIATLDESELRQLYDLHKATIDVDSDLKQLFTARQQQIGVTA